MKGNEVPSIDREFMIAHVIQIQPCVHTLYVYIYTDKGVGKPSC